MAARDRLLETYELFELILLACDAFTILSSTSVCRYWRSFILDSKALRRHMAVIQPPAILPNSTVTTGTDSGAYRLNDRDDTPWCFRHPALHGTLWTLRIPIANIETFLLVPKSPKKPLARLGNDIHRERLLGDRRAWKYGRDGRRRYGEPIIEGPLIPDLEWRTREDNRVVCRTECKQAMHRYNTLREYLTCFYGGDFEELTGERLKPGARNRWEKCCWW